MKTNLLRLLLSVLLLASCGSRKTEIAKLEQNSQLNENTESQSSQSSTSEASASVDLQKFLESTGLKITGNGQNYQLNYGGIIFSGSADLEFNSTKENVKEKYRYINKTQYISHTTYKSVTTYKTQVITKAKSVESERPDPRLRAIIIVITFLLGTVTIPTIKLFINSKIKLKL